MIYRRKKGQKDKKSISTQIALQYNKGSIQERDVHEEFIVFVVRGGECMFVGKESNNQQKGMVKTCENKREYGRTC